MAVSVKEVIEWLQTFPPECSVAVDEGGLTLVVDLEAGSQREFENSGYYYEVGGVPRDEDYEGGYYNRGVE